MNRFTRILTAFLLFVPCTIILFGQAPNIEWQKNLGGSSSDEPRSMDITSDDGYIIAGLTRSNDGDVTGYNDGFDYWIVKLDETGVLEWQKAYGGSKSEIAESIQQTSDDGYIVAGRTNSNDGDITEKKQGLDYWIVKLDESGNIEWEKTLGGNGNDRANSIRQTYDSGYIIAGSTNSNDGDITDNKGSTDCWITKLDSLGNLQWQKTLGGNEIDRAYSIEQTLDRGYIVAGITNSNDGDVTGNNGHFDFWVVKLDSIGNIEWQKSLGGSVTDAALSIKQTIKKGYIVAGRTFSNDGDVTNYKGNGDFWVVKLDSSGNLEWQKTLGGVGDESAISIQEAHVGGYIVAGQTNSFGGDVSGNNGHFDYWIVKLDESGNIEWQKTLGGSEFERAYSILQSKDGSYIIAGMSESNDGDVAGNNGEFDYWVVKLSNVSSLNQGRTGELLNVFPNPTNNMIELSWEESEAAFIEIFDLAGKLVHTQKATGNNEIINLEPILNVKGSYYIRLRDNNGTYLGSQKIIYH